MFRPSDTPPTVGGFPGRSTQHRFAALLLLLPLAAQSGVSAAQQAAQLPAAAGAPWTAPRATDETYQIRCWQFGTLLFEENHVAFPSDPGQYGVKMRGTDRQGRPVYVAETKNATCLIRRVDPHRPWPR